MSEEGSSSGHQTESADTIFRSVTSASNGHDQIKTWVSQWQKKKKKTHTSNMQSKSLPACTSLICQQGQSAQGQTRSLVKSQTGQRHRDSKRAGCPKRRSLRTRTTQGFQTSWMPRTPFSQNTHHTGIPNELDAPNAVLAAHR